MDELLLAAAGLIVLAVAVGLASILRGSDVERLMAVQLLGTGGIGALLLIANATNVPGVEDVALGLALLAALATIALVNLLDTDQGDVEA